MRRVRSELRSRLRALRSGLVARIGRPVRCERCGGVLFQGVPLLWRGRLRLLGAETCLVRADWDAMNRLAFRHVELERCRRG